MFVFSAILLHWVATGVPFPLIHVEHIAERKQTMIRNGIIIIGDAEYSSNIIREYPDDPIYSHILSQGTCCESGVWVGTLRVNHAFPDPHVFDQRKVNLIALALALHPEGISPKAPILVKKTVEHCRDRCESNYDKDPPDFRLGFIVAVEIITRALDQTGNSHINFTKPAPPNVFIPIHQQMSKHTASSFAAEETIIGHER